MKALILSLTLALTLTAGGGSSNRAPAGAPGGLWIENLDASTADNLNENSRFSGDCIPFFENETGRAELIATMIEDNGDIYNVTGSFTGIVTDERPIAVMNSDGVVSFNYLLN